MPLEETAPPLSSEAPTRMVYSVSLPMVLELPTYKMPSLTNALLTAKDQGLTFLKTAGTVIVAICVVMWWLSAYPRVGEGPEVQALRQRAAQAATPEQAEALTTEADILQGRAAQGGSFAGRLGQRVASELVTVIDDGTLPSRRGSLNVDDEGTPTGRTVLIERGVLTGYMQDRLNARLMGMAPTGNGRRESFAHPPMPRMTNTFMLAGEEDPADVLRSVKHGLYAVAFGGGQVDITSGKFVFSASEAYLVEDGKVTAPVKGATLIGNGPDALTRVSRVGRDLALDEGIGTCGKEGQSVPVGVGLPTIRIDAMTVGGTAV